MKKNLLITGLSGFIGKNLIKAIGQSAIHETYNLFALSSQPVDGITTILHRDYTFTKDDLIKAGMNHVDAILHLGAYTPKEAAEAHDIERSFSNIRNTKHLIRSLPNVPEKFIFASTIDVYGSHADAITEKTPTLPESLYGSSKLYCEKMLEAWASQNQVTLQILRIGHVYGAGEEQYKKLIPVTIDRIRQDQPLLIFGDGSAKRSFININDICALILKSFDLKSFAGPINLCSARSTTIKEITQDLLVIADKKIEIQYSVENKIQKNFIFDVSKMHNLLGHEVVLLQDGLAKQYWR